MSSGQLQGEPDAGEEITVALGKAGQPPLEGAVSRDRGEGPFDGLVLRGATVIDGTGAPPWGPVDIVLERDRIVAIVPVGSPKKAIDPTRRPPQGDREIDCHGKFVTPGFVDCHAHIGVPFFYALSGPMLPADYVYKLWPSAHRAALNRRATPWAKVATCVALMGRSQLGRDLYEGVPLLSRSATASRLNRGVNPRLVFVIEHLPARQERIRNIRQTALPHFAEKSLNGNRRYNQAAWLITSGGKRGRA